MNTLKQLFRSVPVLRRLDDWSDTPAGETACYAVIIAFVLMLCLAQALHAL